MIRLDRNDHGDLYIEDTSATSVMEIGRVVVPVEDISDFFLQLKVILGEETA